MNWKTIEHFNNYEVSTCGKVRNKLNGRELKPDINHGGYARVRLFKDKTCYNKLIHRLVAEAFLENNNEKNQVDHIDNNRLNNNLENLRWVSSQENISRIKGVVGCCIGFYKNGRRVRVSYYDRQSKKNIFKTWPVSKYLEAEQYYFEMCGEYEWLE